MTGAKQNQKVQYKKRDKKPAIQIRKWDAQVKTQEDGVTLLTGEDGSPVLPDDRYLSPYFEAISLIGEAFLVEAGERVDRGRALLAAIQASAKKAPKPPASEITASFVEEHGPIRPDLVFVASADAAAIRKLLPKENEALLRNTTIVQNTHIAPLVQECLSDTNEKNPGRPLPNPITRIALNFDQDTGMPQRLAFFDKSKPFSAEGRKAFEVGKVDGVPVNAENVHKFIVPQCHVDGIVNADSVCFSNMGISIPVKMEVAVVEPPIKRAVGLDDVYADEDEEEGEGDEGGEGSGSGDPAGDSPSRASGEGAGAGPSRADDPLEALMTQLSDLPK